MGDNSAAFLENLIRNADHKQLAILLDSGLDPNYKCGILLLYATRHGQRGIAQLLLQRGANPYSPGESGVTPLQLAIYSSSDWNRDDWSFLTDCYSSSQLADAAAIAIVTENLAALNQIFNTGRCNLNIPTSLTGKSVEEIARTHNMSYLLPNHPPRRSQYLRNHSFAGEPLNISSARNLSPFAARRDLSPSVATFFEHAHKVPSPQYAVSPELGSTNRHSSVFLHSPCFSLSPISPVADVK